jgi:hypothetical protein
MKFIYLDALQFSLKIKMKIFPVDKLTLQTALSKTEVIEALKSSLGIQHNIRSFNQPITDKKFQGIITNSGFRIKRIIGYRNSFLPEITGTINEKLSGTEIELVLKPMSFVGVFMAVWLGGVAFACVATLIGAFMGSLPFTACLIPFAMLAFGFGMLKFAFGAESRTAQRELTGLFQAKVKNNEFNA